MPRTEALSIYVSDTAKAELKNKIAGVFENYAKKAISGRLKSKNGVLNEKSGSFEFKRFANATRQERQVKGPRLKRLLWSVKFVYGMALRLFQIGMALYTGISDADKFVEGDMCDALSRRIAYAQGFKESLIKS